MRRIATSISSDSLHRHSGSKTAAIRLSRDEVAVSLEVQDRGKGVPAERLAGIQGNRAGVGITGMRERIRQLKGTMDIQSGADGTKVSAHSRSLLVRKHRLSKVGAHVFKTSSAILRRQKAGSRTESAVRSFLAFCPECKRTQSARFANTADERKISEATFWLILNTRKNVEAVHSSLRSGK